MRRFFLLLSLFLCSGVNASTVVSLVNITFGDVYVCSGQSNMQVGRRDEETSGRGDEGTRRGTSCSRSVCAAVVCCSGVLQ